MENLTPKEKAEELVNKFYCKKDAIGLTFNINWSNAKQCALIAVDEILLSCIGSQEEYWEEVRFKIKKL